MNIFTYDEDTRADIWNKLNRCVGQITYLKCIIQNSTKLTDKDLEQWVRDKNNLINELDIIQEELHNNVHVRITKVNPNENK